MKNLFLVFLIFFSITFFNQISFAQYEDEGVYEDGPNSFLPAAPGTTYTGEEENLYLRNEQPQVANTNLSPAQRTNGQLSGVYEGTRLSCPYAFERDLSVGSKGEDVRLLQVILNSDRRTMITVDGVGSPGKETGTFGEATKDAVKKFQALFIEYIGVANGRFGPRTRTTMNAICAGESPSSGNRQSYENVVPSVQANATPAGEITTIPNDKIAPRINLSANLSSVEPSATFKVIANFSEEIKPLTPDSIIVDGGTVKEIRKLSKTSYSIVITPNEDAKSVLVQVEADKVSDMAGNLNENASNEINVKLRPANTAANNQNGTANLDSLVNKIVSSAPNCNYDSQGKLITINPNTGEPLNPTGCPMTKTNTAPFNSQLGCYGDTGTLPTGITDVQRCSHPQNPNNPSSPCSAQNQAIFRQQLLSYQQQMQQMQQQSMYGYGYGYAPQPPVNPCQNPQIANVTQQQAQQQYQQARQNAQQAQQQAAQNSALGQMIGSLLGKMGGGQQGGQQGGGQNGGGGGGGGGAGTTPGGNPGPQTGPGTTSARTELENKIGNLTDEYANKCTSNSDTDACKKISGEIQKLTDEYAKIQEKESVPPLPERKPNTTDCPDGGANNADLVCQPEGTDFGGKITERTDLKKICSHIEAGGQKFEAGGVFGTQSVLLKSTITNRPNVIISIYLSKEYMDGVRNNKVPLVGKSYVDGRKLKKISDSYKCCNTGGSRGSGSVSCKEINEKIFVGDPGNRLEFTK